MRAYGCARVDYKLVYDTFAVVAVGGCEIRKIGCVLHTGDRNAEVAGEGDCLTAEIEIEDEAIGFGGVEEGGGEGSVLS